MILKFMIHRSKNSFLREKETFRKIAEFYSEKHPDVKFIDKKIRFSIIKGNNRIDFDYGYYHLEKRNFKKYDYVISTGLFAIFNPKIIPGDMILPVQTTHMNINKKRTKLILDEKVIRFHNPMRRVLKNLEKYESGVDKNKIKQFIRESFNNPDSKIADVKNMRIFKDCKLITCNTIFLPSEIKDAKKQLITKNKKTIELKDLKKYLETNTDGLNCETKALVENARNKTLLLSWGLDKPYRIVEATDELRDEKNYGKLIPTFNLAQVKYFYFILIGYLLERDFKL
ncbi:MAG: hypothetical protein ACP5N3_00505 [Candidatus Nanoarchaeia archaeon]